MPILSFTPLIKAASDHLLIICHSKPNGINITQGATEIAIANAIGLELKAGTLVPNVAAFSESLDRMHDTFGSEYQCKGLTVFV